MSPLHLSSIARFNEGAGFEMYNLQMGGNAARGRGPVAVSAETLNQVPRARGIVSECLSCSHRRPHTT